MSILSFITLVLTLIRFAECLSVTPFSPSPNKPYPGSPANESWSYSEVRAGSFLFWWLYFSPSYATDPLIIFLHGGPGTSATAESNFGEFGPFDLKFNRRNNSLISRCSLVFVDAPAGTGLSFLTNPTAYSFTKEAAADDLIQWFKDFITRYPMFRSVPIHILSESFGVRWAIVFANKLSLIQTQLTSLVMSAPLVNIYETMEEYGRFLYSFSLADDVQKEAMDQEARVIVQSLKNNDTLTAVSAGNKLTELYGPVAYGTYVLNIMYDSNGEVFLTGGVTQIGKHSYPSILWLNGGSTRYAAMMNGPIRDYLKIPSFWAAEVIPTELVMLPVDQYVDLVPDIDFLLMNTRLKLTVVVDQLDMLFSFTSHYRWMERLQWSGRPEFMRQKRQVFDGKPGFVKAFRKRHHQLTVYTALHSGHEAPIDQPDVMHKIMIDVLFK